MIPQSQIVFYIMIILIVILFTKNLEKFTITRPSKCFSCERDMINRTGILSVWKALPTKCFDCEHQAEYNDVNPYKTGPTKCFDCDCDYFKNNNKEEKSIWQKLFD